MLSIQRSSAHSGKTTPNLLPCRIEHNGPVNAAERYWQPQEEKGARRDMGKSMPMLIEISR